MDVRVEHRKLTATLFNTLKTAYHKDDEHLTKTGQNSVYHADARAFLLSEYYTGDHWGNVSNLLILGDRIGEKVSFPKSKVRFLDPRTKPILWPRWRLLEALGDRQVFEFLIKHVHSHDHLEYPAFREALKVTKGYALLSQGREGCYMTYFDEADAILAKAIMDEATSHDPT